MYFILCSLLKKKVFACEPETEHLLASTLIVPWKESMKQLKLPKSDDTNPRVHHKEPIEARGCSSSS